MEWTGNGRLPIVPSAKTVFGDSVGRDPADRGKAASKRSILVDGSGGPLSVVVAGANVHDANLLAMTLEKVVVEPPDAGIQHLCLDKGYDNPTGHWAVAAHGYRGHIRRIGVEYWTPRVCETLSGAAVGCGAHAGLAIPSAGRSWRATTRRYPTTSDSSAIALKTRRASFLVTS